MAGFSPNRVIRRVLAGDREAYRLIVRACQREVWRLAVHLLHDREEAEELVQETFVRAYLHLDRFDPAGDFTRWLRGIARNIARERMRSRSGPGKHLLAYYALIEERERAEEEREVTYRERLSAALKKCRERLSPRLNAMLDMRYVHALSLERMAAHAGKTIEATRQLLWRVKIKLKKCIQKELGNGWNG